ncbi:glycosyltransferase family 4 protein [Oceanobacillus massiliensis]|uniref:glycosyltransferase family 4 protein n=1 Tax=Oceanobacillus massiliensis TaxID=1465765 RepID=UPI000288D079|nr:glycosyltransferase [Oceanobacillus massiliensis]
MKKVLILVNHDVVIYNFRKELVVRLIEDGYKVYISSPFGERIDELVKIGCEFIETKIERHGLNVLQELKLIQTYKQIIKHVNPNVVLSYTIKPNIYGAIAASNLNKPIIANITGLGTAVENKGLMQRITVTLYKFAFRKAHTVFFQNQENQQFFIDKKIAIGKHKLIPGSGVNLEHFSPLEYPYVDTLEFIFISRIMKEKGIDQYIEAAKYIREKYPNTKFHILGFCEGDYEDELRRLEREEIIIYHGMQRDIRNFLKNTHCSVHPTYYPEGMSNVLLESAASARPIITTNRSGCREIVDDGINGYLIKKKIVKILLKK